MKTINPRTNQSTHSLSFFFLCLALVSRFNFVSPISRFGAALAFCRYVTLLPEVLDLDTLFKTPPNRKSEPVQYLATIEECG